MAASCALARQKLARFVAELRDPGMVEKVTTGVKAGYVGSIVTPMRAVVGNLTWGGLRHLVHQPVEAGVDYLLATARSAGTGFRVSPREFRQVASALDADGVRAMLGGFRKGTKPVTEGFRAARERGGTFGAQLASFVDEVRLRLDAEEIARIADFDRVKYDSPVTQALVDGAFTVLEAADRPFWKLAFDGSLYAQAKLMAIKAGAKGAARKQLAREFFESPSDEMLMRAADDAHYATFKDRNVFSETATLVKRGIARRAATAPDPDAAPSTQARQRFLQRTFQGAQLAVEVNVPFSGVPSSVAGKVGAFSPFGLVQLAFVGSQQQAARALAALGIGSVMWAVGYKLAADGLVSGDYPREHPSEAAQGDLEGFQPNSVRVGDAWVGIQSLGPAGVPFLMGAQLYKLRHEDPEAGVVDLAAGAAGAMGRTMTEASYLRGVRQILDFIEDPTGAGGKRFVASQIPIPAVAGQAARALDPVAREGRTVEDQLLRRIPGASRLAPPRLDPTGAPVTRSPLERASALLSPLPLRRITEDAVTRELRRLGVFVGRPARTRTVDGERVRLTEAEYAQLLRDAGGGALAELRQVIADPTWRSPTLTDEDRREIVEDILREHRRAGRAALSRGRM